MCQISVVLSVLFILVVVQILQSLVHNFSFVLVNEVLPDGTSKCLGNPEHMKVVCFSILFWLAGLDFLVCVFLRLLRTVHIIIVPAFLL